MAALKMAPGPIFPRLRTLQVALCRVEVRLRGLRRRYRETDSGVGILVKNGSREHIVQRHAAYLMAVV